MYQWDVNVVMVVGNSWIEDINVGTRRGWQATGCRRLGDQVGCEGTMLVSESYKVSNELYMLVTNETCKTFSDCFGEWVT